MPLHRRALLAAAAALPVLPARAQPRPWPNRPVRLIIPFAPGGPVEVPARPIAEHLGQRLGQPFVVETRPGAGGALGIQAVVASNDGHTMLFTTSSVAILPALMRDPGYDPFRDLIPISLVSDVPMALLSRPDGPVRDLNDLVVKSRARPGSVSFASSGSGSTTHLAGELLKARAGIDLLHIPYRGAGQAVNALYAGDTDLLVTGLIETMPHVREGRLRAVAVTSPQRSAALPDVPSLAEVAPGYGITIWYAMFAPRGTPDEVVQRLAQEVAPIASGTPLAARLEASGGQLLLDGPAPLAERMRVEVPQWREIARAGNIRAE